MTDQFEDHCWKDVVTPDLLEIYASYRRKVLVGPSPALLAIDLYELVYRGGPRAPAELVKAHPSSCGEYAYAAIEPHQGAVCSCTRGRPSNLLFDG
jgi:hypothetical protein